MTLVAICFVIPQRMCLSGTVMEIWLLKDNGVTTLTFWGYVTSSDTWPIDSGIDFLWVVYSDYASI